MISLNLYFVSSKESAVIGSNYIVKDSVKVKEELINNLKSSSNQITLQVLGDCAVVEKVIKEERDIKAQLLDDDVVIFTGYLSTNWSFTVSHTGANAVNITLEDVGTRLLAKEFIERGAHLFDCTVHDALVAICQKANVEINPDTIMLSNKVVKTVKGGDTCKALLQELLYEVGYVYYFDTLGRLLIFPLAVDVKEVGKRLNGSNLLTGISVKKSIREYSAARVSYKSVARERNTLVYRNTTGQSTSHPFCYLALNGNHIFDGAETWPAAEESDHIYPHIQAVNADGNESISSNEIIAISDIKVGFVSDSSYIEPNVEATGGPYLKIRVENKNDILHYVTRLDVFASVLYYKSTEIIRAACDEIAEESGSVFSEELSWLHDRASCQRFANLISQYHRYSSSLYTFYSPENIPPGTIIRLTDDIFTGLDVNVLVTKRSYKYQGTAFTYEAVGISEFNLDKEVIEERIYNTAHPIKGENGKDAIQVVVLSSSGTIYRRGDDDFKTTLEAKVFQGGEDVTEKITGEHFKWRRVSNYEADDALWNSNHNALMANTLNITLSDLNGRCTFFAEYIE